MSLCASRLRPGLKNLWQIAAPSAEKFAAFFVRPVRPADLFADPNRHASVADAKAIDPTGGNGFFLRSLGPSSIYAYANFIGQKT